MNRTATTSCLALGLALAFAGPAFAQSYDDAKFYSAGAHCTPYTSGTPDYSKLRFRAEGVANESTTYQYVICSLGSDAETGWGTGRSFDTQVGIRSNTIGTTQCTLTHGTNAFGTQAETQSVEGVVGSTVWINFLTSSTVEWATSSLVCRIAPKHTITLIWQQEMDTQTDGYVYVPL